MLDNIYQNWPVYLGIIGFVVFVISAILNSREQEKKNKEAQNKDKQEKDK